MSKEEGEAFAEENGLDYVECSAKSASGVEDAFMRTTAQIWEKMNTGRIILKPDDVQYSIV